MLFDAEESTLIVFYGLINKRCNYPS